MTNGNFYSACIYDILKDRRRSMEEKLTLNHLIAKTARLYSKQFQYIVIDTHEATLFQGEIPSLSHLLQLPKRRVSRLTTSVVDKASVTQTTNRGILHTFVEFLQSKYDPIEMDDAFLSRMEKAGHRILPLGWRDFLDTPITEEELKTAVSKESCNKATGKKASDWNFLKLTGTISGMTCWPYSTGYSWMGGSWKNRNMTT